MNYNKLTLEKEKAIVNKPTEVQFKGEYNNFHGVATLICQRCNATLFPSKSKFDPRRGWPSLGENPPNAIKRIADHDGMRTEIQCTNRNAHLGHDFAGEEHFTDKNLGNALILYLCFLFQRKRSCQKQHE